MNKEELKKGLKKILEHEKGFLWVEWDCGGDETLCWFNSHEEKWASTENQKVKGSIIGSIIDTLNLPNAGEYYHKGKGKVGFDEKEQIVLRFDSKEYNYDFQDFWETIELKDPANLRKYLHKTEVTFEGEAGKQINPISRIEFRIIEGDELLFPEEKLLYYKNIIKELLNKYLNMYTEKQEDLEHVELFGELKKEKTVLFEINVEMHDSTYHKNETVVLFS